MPVLQPYAPPAFAISNLDRASGIAWRINNRSRPQHRSADLRTPPSNFSLIALNSTDSPLNSQPLPQQPCPFQQPYQAVERRSQPPGPQPKGSPSLSDCPLMLAIKDYSIRGPLKAPRLEHLRLDPLPFLRRVNRVPKIRPVDCLD